MRRIFGALLVLGAVLYVVAEATLERPGKDEIVPLRWSTDPNPARRVQTSRFAGMFPGFLVEVDPGLGNDRTKLIVQCATGTGPDIVDVGGKSGLMTLVEAGILLDLTPYAKEMGFGPEETWEAVRPDLEIDGRQYLFPCNVWANCVIYNREVFDDHGAPYPAADWTYDDFIRIGKMIADRPGKSGKKHYAVANWSGLWMVQDLLVGHGARQFSEDGLVCTLDSPEAIAAMRFYHDLMFVHEVVPSAAELSTVSSQGGWGSFGLNIFSAGLAGMVYIGRWYLVQVPNYPRLRGNLGAAPLPRVGRRPSAGMCGTRAAGINVKSERWEDALKFLKYLASREYSELIVADGDSLPPNPKYARTGRDLVNDAVREPAFHQTFVDAMRRAVPLDLSPFVESELIGRWMDERVGEVENRLVTPEKAMRALADEINARIRLNLERRPDLRRLVPGLDN